MRCSNLVVDGMQKAVGFLVEEVYQKGDVALGKLGAYAAALRSLADAIDRRENHQPVREPRKVLSMATSYTGIYSIKDSSGRITDVQVQDTGGNGLPLPIDEYERRGVQPPAESLPDQNS